MLKYNERKKKKMISEEELTEFIVEIISNGDLNSLTFSKIFEQLQTKYPSEDFTERKSFLRSKVKQLVQEEQQKQEEKEWKERAKVSSTQTKPSKEKKISAAPKKRPKEENEDRKKSSKRQKTSNENEEIVEKPTETQNNSNGNEPKTKNENNNADETKEAKSSIPAKEEFFDIEQASEEEKKLQSLLFEAFRFGVAEGPRSTRSSSRRKSYPKSTESKKVVQEGSEDSKSNRKKEKKRVRLCALSPALSEFLGEEELPRGEVVKRLHAYIKEKNLQNPKNRREILFDKKLQDVFKQKKTDYFKINKLIAVHAKAVEDVI